METVKINMSWLVLSEIRDKKKDPSYRNKKRGQQRK